MKMKKKLVGLILGTVMTITTLGGIAFISSSMISYDTKGGQYS